LNKFFIIVMVLMITYLSNIPDLKVTDINTWANKPHYEEKISAVSLIKFSSSFYNLYKKPFTTEFYMHKLGHITSYALLTIFLITTCTQTKKRKILVGVFLFALIDECHQFFVVGRSGRIMDVILDSCISLVTILMIIGIKKWIFKTRNSAKSYSIANE
jgi:VanZ family protein